MTTSRIVVDAARDDLWADLVSRTSSSVFHSPAWLQVLADTYGFEVKGAVLADSLGQAIAGLAYVDIADMMDRRIVSLPFSDYCDPLVSDAEQWNQLVTPLLAEDAKIRLRCLLNDTPSEDSRFAQVARAKWHGVDLTAGVDQLWDQIDSSARRAIRKARSQGVEVRPAANLEDVRTFFELHLKVRKYKYRLLPQPYSFFEAIWKHILGPGRGTLLLAFHEGSAVGGVLFLEWQDTLYYKFNASHIDQLAVRPNDMLIWEGMSYAVARGLNTLDFGLSDWDQEGLLRYKRKYATEERTIRFLESNPPRTPTPEDQQMRALLPALTDLLVSAEVSDDVTERAGDVLYRYFI